MPEREVRLDPGLRSLRRDRPATRERPHPPTVQLVVLGQDDRRRVRPVFEERPVDPQKPVERGRVERPHAAPEHQQVAPRDGRDRIELQTADRAGDLQQLRRTRAGGTRAGQPLLRDRETASHDGRDGAGGRHGLGCRRYRLASNSMRSGSPPTSSTCPLPSAEPRTGGCLSDLRASSSFQTSVA